MQIIFDRCVQFSLRTNCEAVKCVCFLSEVIVNKSSSHKDLGHWLVVPCVVTLLLPLPEIYGNTVTCCYVLLFFCGKLRFLATCYVRTLA